MKIWRLLLSNFRNSTKNSKNKPYVIIIDFGVTKEE
jgi:hypothetical protein